MPVFLSEVPAFIKHADRVENTVSVKGGTNWDLSRSAVETPVTPLAPVMSRPAPAEMPTIPASPEAGAAPCSDSIKEVNTAKTGALTVLFGKNSAVLSDAAKLVLTQAPIKGRARVAGYADARESSPKSISLSRAQAVANFLAARKQVVDSLEAKGALEPVTGSPMHRDLNRRVTLTTE